MHLFQSMFVRVFFIFYFYHLLVFYVRKQFWKRSFEFCCLLFMKKSINWCEIVQFYSSQHFLYYRWEKNKRIWNRVYASILLLFYFLTIIFLNVFYLHFCLVYLYSNIKKKKKSKNLNQLKKMATFVSVKGLIVVVHVKIPFWSCFDVFFLLLWWCPLYPK